MKDFKTVAELLADEKRWTQGEFAKTASGQGCVPHNPNAVCFCLWGAMTRVYQSRDAHDKAVEKLQAVIGRHQRIAQFNDTHTHAEVLAAVKEAGI